MHPTLTTAGVLAGVGVGAFATFATLGAGVRALVDDPTETSTAPPLSEALRLAGPATVTTAILGAAGGWLSPVPLASTRLGSAVVAAATGAAIAGSVLGGWAFGLSSEP